MGIWWQGRKVGVCIITAGTGNSGRLNRNCKAITLEIYSYWCYMDYVASLLNESFSFFFFFSWQVNSFITCEEKNNEGYCKFGSWEIPQTNWLTLSSLDSKKLLQLPVIIFSSHFYSFNKIKFLGDLHFGSSSGI